MTALTATQRADLAGIPLPSDPVSDTCMVAAPGGWSVAWVRDGRFKVPIGPVFANPILASQASHFLRELHGLRA